MNGVGDVRDDSRRQKDSIESGLSRNYSSLHVAVEFISMTYLGVQKDSQRPDHLQENVILVVSKSLSLSALSD